MLYRKEICTLTHFSEEQYYSNFFDDNVIYIRKTKKTWEEINNVLASKMKQKKPSTSV